MLRTDSEQHDFAGVHLDRDYSSATHHQVLTTDPAAGVDASVRITRRNRRALRSEAFRQLKERGVDVVSPGFRSHPAPKRMLRADLQVDDCAGRKVLLAVDGPLDVLHGKRHLFYQQIASF